MALAACSNDGWDVDGVSSKYITFGTPAVQAVARDALVSFPNGGQFQVLGYLKSYSFSGGTLQGELDEGSVSTAWKDKEAVTPPSVFGGDAVNQAGVSVTYNNGSCTYTPLTRWHEDEEALYSFYYYYPASGYFSTAFDDIAGKIVGLPRLTFTMPFSGGDEGVARDMLAVPDAMYGFSQDVSRGGMLVPVFHHLLAGLRMQVNNYSTTSDVTVNSLRVYAPDFRRDVTLNDDFALAVGSQVFGGSFQFGSESVTVPKVETASGSVETASGNSEQIGGTLLLVPYTSATGVYFGDGAEVEISYNFNGHAQTKRQSLAFGLTIDPGYIYTLQLNFVGSDLVLEFIADNNQQWEEGNEGSGSDSSSNENITFE